MGGLTEYRTSDRSLDGRDLRPAGFLSGQDASASDGFDGPVGGESWTSDRIVNAAPVAHLPHPGAPRLARIWFLTSASRHDIDSRSRNIGRGACIMTSDWKLAPPSSRGRCRRVPARIPKSSASRSASMTIRSIIFCSKEPCRKVSTGRARSSSGTSANTKCSDPHDPIGPRRRSATGPFGSSCLARNFEGSGRSFERPWEREAV